MNEQFTQIYESYYSMIYRYFFYKSGNKQMSEDLTAEVFVKAYTNLMRFDERKANIKTWLMMLAKNIYIDNYRKYKNYIYVSTENIIEMSDITDFENAVITDDTYNILYKAIAELNEKERNLIALKYSSEFKNKDIAVLLGKSERHTAVLLGRIITKLKKILIKMGVDNYE